MATILRSSKHVRNFFERLSKVGVSRVKCEVYPYQLFLTNSLPSTTFARSLTVQPSTNLLEHHTNVETGNSKLEKMLQGLDQEVRQFGRITKIKFEYAFKQFLSSPSVSSNQALMMIRCCGSLVSDELPEIRTQWVNQIWKVIKSSGISVNLSHYNALLRVYVENEYAFSPAEVLAELLEEGLEPNKLTYQRLINRYCQQGDTEGATKILQFMREKGISVNENIFNALIRGHSEAGDIASAAEIPSLMKQAGLEPTPDTYRELLCAYAKHGDIRSIFDTIEKCRTLNTLLLTPDFLAIVYSLASNGHGKSVSQIMPIIPQSFGYRQDAVSTVQKLLNIGQIEIAMQVLHSIPQRDQGFTGTAMLRNLGQSNLPPRQIVELCHVMQSNGIHSEAFITTLKGALVHGNVEASLTLLNYMKSAGEEVREHYFWPLLVSLGKSKDDAGVNNLLYKMKRNYNLISATTLIEWVLPYKTGDPAQIMADLSTTQIPSGSIAAAITHHLISNIKLQEAADFVRKSFFRYNSTYQRPLLKALEHTGDVESFVKILQHINHTSIYQSATNDRESIDPYVIGIPNYIDENPPIILTAVLEQIYSAGMSLKHKSISNLRQRIGSRITPKLSQVLSQLEDGNKSFGNTKAPLLRKIKRLENSLVSPDSTPTEALEKKLQLVRLYCVSGLIPQVETILQELEKEGSELDEITLSFVIDAYCGGQMLAKAEDYVQLLKKKYSNYDKSIVGLFRYMHLLVENDRIDDMLKMASEIQCSPDQQEFMGTKWSQLLNELADTGKPELVNKLFELITQKHSNNVSPQMCQQLVRVHLVSNDTKGALDTFEKIHEKYKCTPMKNTLTKQLIKEEDTIGLQRLTNLSTRIHGETNSLYDLARGFIEMDCIRQAQKILEIPALHSKIQRLVHYSQEYSEQGHVKYLENLISSVKDIPNVNRIPKFYCHLLVCYDRNNDWEKGLQLWRQMQESDIQPSPDFYGILANLLQRHEQTIPFPITDPEIQQVMRNGSSQYGLNRGEKSESRNHKRWESRPRPENVTNSSKSSSPIREEELRKNNETIRKLLDDEKFSELYEVFADLSRKSSPVGSKCLVDMFKKLSDAGEVDWIIKCGEQLSPVRMKVVNYYNMLGYAYVNAGRTEEYLDNLEKNVPSTTTPVTGNAYAIIPMLCFRNIMQKPEFTERCIKIATKYADQGIIYPINAVWIQYSIDNHPNADKIWSKYIVKSKIVRFDNIVWTAVENNDPDLLKRLIKKLWTAPGVHVREIAKVYSKLIGIYNSKAEYDNGLNALEDALRSCPPQVLQRNVLVNLEEGLKSLGKTFPKHIVDQIPWTRDDI